MTIQNSKTIIEELKDIAKGYDIKILLPSANQPQKEDLFKSTASMVSAANHVISIQRKSSPNMKTKLQVSKTRFTCPILEAIKNNEKEVLQYYLQKGESNIETVVTISNYKLRLTTSIVYVLKNQLYDYLEILESSKIFEKCDLNNTDFWIRNTFKADNYEILAKKVTVEDILNYANFHEQIRVNAPVTIMTQLMKENAIKNKMQSEFELGNFIPISMGTNHSKVLEVVLDNISIDKELNFKEIAEIFDKTNGMDSIENNLYYYNEIMKTFIIHSDYHFKETDEAIDSLTQENKQLISKRRLNEYLEENLTPKNNVKKPKI